MVRKVLAIIAFCLLFTLCCTRLVMANDETTNSEDYIPSETIKIEKVEPQIEYVEVEVPVELTGNLLNYVETNDSTKLRELMKECEERKNSAHVMAEGARACGYPEDHPIILLAIDEWKNADELYNIYKEKCNGLIKAEAWEEYPVATEAWLYMKNEFGWNDIVCAGIIGNLMAECGGCWTQDLDWAINTVHGMGVVQWIGGRQKQLIEYYGDTPSIIDQLNFMRDELYGLNGVTKQVTDSQLDKIMNAETPEDCAFAFATYYERCAEQHRYPRRGYARKAYEYFVD